MRQQTALRPPHQATADWALQAGQGAINPSNNNVTDRADKDCSSTAVRACVKFVRQRQCRLCMRIQQHIVRDVKACTCMYMCIMLSD